LEIFPIPAHLHTNSIEAIPTILPAAVPFGYTTWRIIPTGLKTLNPIHVQESAINGMILVNRYRVGRRVRRRQVPAGVVPPGNPIKPYRYAVVVIVKPWIVWKNHFLSCSMPF
jgi:hypothetical protein